MDYRWCVHSSPFPFPPSLVLLCSPTRLPPPSPFLPHLSISAQATYCTHKLTHLPTTQPIVAVQNHLPPPLISTGLAAVVFSQQFGPALFLSLAQTVFSTTLTSNLHSVPNVNTTAIIDSGATGFREIVGTAEIAGVVKAYSGSVNNVFYLITGAGGLAFLSAWGIGWRSVRKPKGQKVGTEGVEKV